MMAIFQVIYIERSERPKINSQFSLLFSKSENDATRWTEFSLLNCSS